MLVQVVHILTNIALVKLSYISQPSLTNLLKLVQQAWLTCLTNQVGVNIVSDI